MTSQKQKKTYMDDENGAILSDAPDAEFDIEAAFLSNLQGASRPPEGAEKGTEDEGSPETPDAPETTDEDESTDAPTKDKTPPSPEDAEIDVKVGEETHKVKLKDLTRLYGQEASLTRKSMEVAQARQHADAEATRASTALKGMLERANARWEPYSKIDFLVQAQVWDAETLQAVRADAMAAANDVRFLTEELAGVEKVTNEARTAAANQEAQATIKELENPTTGIKGFGPAMYQEITGYMVEQGFPAERARSITSAAALRIAHKAMMFDRQSVSAAEKVTKVVQKATKTIAPGSGHPNAGTRNGNSAMARLRASGSTDDAADAFYASMRNE